MPLGAFRINAISKIVMTATVEVIRRKVNIAANGNAQLSTTQSQFGGTSAYFDGTNDFLRVYNPGTLAFDTNDFTIECWVRPTGTKKQYPLIIHNYIDGSFDATGSWFLADRHDSANTKFTLWVDNFNGQSSPMLTSTTSVSTNTWYHIAIVRTGTTFRMFVNGTQEATATFSGSFDSNLSNNWGIGDWNSGTVNGYTGWIDEIRVSKTARYSANFTPTTVPFVNDDNTVLLIHCDGTNATTFFEDDNGVRGKQGVRCLGTAKISTSQSKFGGSSGIIDSQGSAFLVGPAQNFNIGTGAYTIEGWFRWTISDRKQVLVDARFPNNNWGLLSILNTGKIEYFDGGVRNSTATLTTNTWYHLAVVRSGTTIKCYINGSEDTGFTGTGNTLNVTSNGPIHIGNTKDFASFTNEWLNGFAEEVRISNVARYTSNFTAPTEPFVNDANTLVLLHFDGTNNSTVVLDDTGNRTQKGIRTNNSASISTTQSKFGGSSFYSPGYQDSLTVGNSPDFAIGTGNFTIEYWLYPTTLSSNFEIHFDTRPQGTNGPQHTIYTNNGTIYYFANNGNRITGSTLSTNQWYHIAVSRSGTSTRMFVNGTQVGSTYSDSTSYTCPQGITISMDQYDPVNKGVIGYKDEIRFSNIARYTANFTAPTAPFVNDNDTLLLIHADGTNGSTAFFDDNGIAPYTP